MYEKNDDGIQMETRRDAIRHKLTHLPDLLEAALSSQFTVDCQKNKLLDWIRFHTLKVERAVSSEKLPSEDDKPPKNAFPNETLRGAEVARRLSDDAEFQKNKDLLTSLEEQAKILTNEIIVINKRFSAAKKLADLEVGGK